MRNTALHGRFVTTLSHVAPDTFTTAADMATLLMHIVHSAREQTGASTTVQDYNEILYAMMHQRDRELIPSGFLVDYR
jgi:D-alanyl-D-alanine carboxypeptidase